MTTRELLYIKTIADERSLTRAAQKLYVTQPSLSHCVAVLEQQLGTKLFRRTSGGLLLTYAGEKYYRMACEVLRVYHAFEAEISDESALARGRVTFGITNYLATDHLPRMLPAFTVRQDCQSAKKVLEASSSSSSGDKSPRLRL